MDAPVEAPISVRLVDGPLGPSEVMDVPPDAGAVVSFEGIVRPFEGHAPIAGLDYEAYEPMATTQLRRLAEDVVGAHELFVLRAAHSTGRVAVGECSFRLVVAAAHRAEALDAMAEFIDRMKRDVPIWKTPVAV